jgi:hypothetical protein
MVGLVKDALKCRDQSGQEFVSDGDINFFASRAAVCANDGAQHASPDLQCVILDVGMIESEIAHRVPS